MCIPDSPAVGDGGHQGVVGSRYRAGSRERLGEPHKSVETRPTKRWAQWVWRLAQALLDGDLNALQGLDADIRRDVIAAANGLWEELR